MKRPSICSDAQLFSQFTFCLVSNIITQYEFLYFKTVMSILFLQTKLWEVNNRFYSKFSQPEGNPIHTIYLRLIKNN